MKKDLAGLAARIVLAAFAILAGTPAQAAPVNANASEQIIFSGIGSGTFDGTPTSVGFWIWCQTEEDSHSPMYAGECNGAMYFYALGITRHVEGEVSEPEEGIYVMDVASTRDSTVSCRLTNASAELNHGPNNTVNIECDDPSGTGTSSTAVVNVTGP